MVYRCGWTFCGFLVHAMIGLTFGTHRIFTIFWFNLEMIIDSNAPHRFVWIQLCSLCIGIAENDNYCQWDLCTFTSLESHSRRMRVTTRKLFVYSSRIGYIVIGLIVYSQSFCNRSIIMEYCNWLRIINWVTKYCAMNEAPAWVI